MKKALELQFHWIFVLIAGAIILAFFFSVVQKQRSYAEERVSIRLSTDVEAIFSGAIESKGTVQFLPTPQPGISFSCSNACECNFGIGKKATGFRDKIMFAPDFLEEYDIVAWALEWKQPFRITNFLYMTNNNIKYYLIYREGMGESERLQRTISKALPADLNLEVLSDPAELSNILPGGWQETKLIFVAIDPGDYINLLDAAWTKEPLSVIRLSPPHVEFWVKQPKQLSFAPYSSVLAGEPTYYAAMFAADQTMYECGLEAGFTRLIHVAEVVKERTEKINEELGMRCTYFTDRIDDLIAAATQITQGRTEALGEISTYVEEVEQQNRRMIQESCPEMY